MVIVWQTSVFPSSDIPDYGAAYVSNALVKVPGDPPTVPFNSSNTYLTTSGVIDGVNAVFTLNFTPMLTLQLYTNGMQLTQGAGNDYTLSGNTVTFQAGRIPQPGDVIVAIALLSTAYSTLTGAINGVNTLFTLASPPNFLALYRNGILQNPGVGGVSGDYTLSGSSITFLPGAIPQTGDILLAKTQ